MKLPSVPSERPHGALVPASEAAEQLGGVLASRRGRPRVQALHYAAAAALSGDLLPLVCHAVMHGAALNACVYLPYYAA